MNHVQQAVATIRKSLCFALLADNEPITVEALQRDIDAFDAELDAIEDDLELAKIDGDEPLVASIQANLDTLYPAYSDFCAQLALLQAAIASDAGSIH